jgi:hypothetical protein
MYELNRVRLAGIGPRGARYTDVTLDLSGVGPPAGPATLHGSPARRPSPVALLMLENGGGKPSCSSCCSPSSCRAAARLSAAGRHRWTRSF